MNLYHWVIIRWGDTFWLRSLDCSDCCISVHTVDPDGWVEWVSRQPWSSPGAWIELQYLLTPEDEHTETEAA